MADDISGPTRKPRGVVLAAFEAWPATHVLCVGMIEPQAGLAALLAGLAEAKARLDGLSVKPSGDRFEGIVRLSGVSCEDARSIAAALAADRRILSSSVEHHLFKAP